MQATIKSAAKGIPEIPNDLGVQCPHCQMKIPGHPQLRRVLVSMREELLNARRLRAPLDQPGNFTVTPQDRANLLQFTRPTNADFFEILWNSTPDYNTAQVLGTSSANRYTDYVGQVNTKRFYWVQARNYAGAVSGVPAGPVAGTTLVVGSTVTPPTPAVSGKQQHKNLLTGQRQFQ